MCCFKGIFRRENGPSRDSWTRPIKGGKRLIKEGKRPIKAHSWAAFGQPPPWWTTTPLNGPLRGLFFVHIHDSLRDWDYRQLRSRIGRKQHAKCSSWDHSAYVPLFPGRGQPRESGEASCALGSSALTVADIEQVNLPVFRTMT